MVGFVCRGGRSWEGGGVGRRVVQPMVCTLSKILSRLINSIFLVSHFLIWGGDMGGRRGPKGGLTKLFSTGVRRS